MADLESTVRALAERVQILEDRLAIYQLIATYGPAVDSCSGPETAAIWTEDGVYDTDGNIYRGSAGLQSIVTHDTHLGYVKAGSAHVMSLPHVVVEGDRAVATGYSRVYLHDKDGFRIARTSANRWELERTPQGWRCRHRTNRLITGGEEPRALLAQGVRKPAKA
jgi:hypothetical protein